MIETFGNNQILAGKDVIVIGAGISGLVAASTLVQKGANVIILEAKNYIGGRIRTDRSLDVPFEYGAGWIHGPSKENPIRNLAERSNSSLFVRLRFFFLYFIVLLFGRHRDFILDDILT